MSGDYPEKELDYIRRTGDGMFENYNANPEELRAIHRDAFRAKTSARRSFSSSPTDTSLRNYGTKRFFKH